MNKVLKIVVFDLDETLGYFTEFGIFCDCLNMYLNNNNYSEKNFNELLDLYPDFLRPNIIQILQYLKNKKKEGKCYKVMIYTNNQAHKKWSLQIKDYFDSKIKHKLFDQVIGAFKVRGKQVEMGRTTHDKTLEDFIRCTKLPDNIELCFVDDVYHEGMIDEKIYYINVKPYVNQIKFEKMLTLYANSKMGKHIKNKEYFFNVMKKEFDRYNYYITEKSKEELEIDNIVSKRVLQHLKRFFYEKNNKTFKRKRKTERNKTAKVKK